MCSRRLDFTVAGWRVALIGIGRRGRFGYARRGPNVIEAGLGIVGVIAVRERPPLILTFEDQPEPKNERRRPPLMLSDDATEVPPARTYRDCSTCGTWSPGLWPHPCRDCGYQGGPTVGAEGQG